MPAAVPVAVFTPLPEELPELDDPLPPPHEMTLAATTRTATNQNWEANRGARRVTKCRPNHIDSIARTGTNSNGSCGHGIRGNLEGGTAAWAVVDTVSITTVGPLPAGIADGENDVVAPVGAGVIDAASDTVLVIVAPAGTTIKLKTTCCPAVTEAEGVCTFKLKSCTANVNAGVTPPPGAGLFTVMLSVPLWAKSVADKAACSNVELTKVVWRLVPFARTAELLLKFVPVTLSVIAGLPAGLLEGERLLVIGTGLFTTNVVTSDGAPPGFATVTNGVPAAAIALAGIAACNCVWLTNAEDTMLELKVTMEPEVKPLPDSVIVNAGPPAVVLAGLNAPTAGWVFVGRIVSGNVELVPPPNPFTTESVTEILLVP